MLIICGQVVNKRMIFKHAFHGVVSSNMGCEFLLTQDIDRENDGQPIFCCIKL